MQLHYWFVTTVEIESEIKSTLRVYLVYADSNSDKQQIPKVLKGHAHGLYQLLNKLC